ncbi:hypothetical protein AB0L35_11345 [Streptomyces sp. NPDC052309]|uniref:Secreted protein n=1 Tax=Streptomyces griseicoloratus TaxID=2752516 RepID=A0A926L4V3_9ACTN|nr:hypothetical protein [Streptomyces griseicoloratus]MBD0420441.1 hypothetical protein [Streptomyces griseicoloratus]
MRRITAALGVLASVGALALAPQAPSAAAATGVLIVNGQAHTNPHGCYPANGFMVTVVNNTDRTAYIYPNAGCWGAPEGWVLPGGRTTQNGASVYIE